MNKNIPTVLYLEKLVMKLSLLSHFYIFSIVTVYSPAYSMDGPPIHPFVTEILTLTTQCINAESSHLESWMSNKQNPLVELKLKILGEYPTEDQDEKIAHISFLLGSTTPESEKVFTQIGNLEIIEKRGLHSINKPLLKKFRIGITMHNQLIDEELQSIKKALECSQTTDKARAENRIYAKELVGVSNPRISCLLPEEQNIIQLLRKQRIGFQVYGLIESKPPLSWFVDQEKLLTEYLRVQNEYLHINPLLSDQKKNEGYKKELEKTILAIKKDKLKTKIQKTRECFLRFPCLRMLQKHKSYVAELQAISPTPEKKETIELISCVEKDWELVEQRQQKENAARLARQKKRIEAKKARIRAEQAREKERQDTINLYETKDLTQATIQILLKDIKALIVLRKTDRLNQKLSEVYQRYIDTLTEKLPLQHLQPQDFKNCLTPNENFRSMANSVITAYLNKLLTMIQTRSGLFQNKSQSERLSLFFDYFPENFADTGILKDWHTQMQHACKNTVSEKIFIIISWPFTLLFAPFTLLSDFYWPLCG